MSWIGPWSESPGPRTSPPVPERHAADRSVLALRFAGLGSCVLTLAVGLAWGLIRTFGRKTDGSPWTMIFHPAFAISSVLLLGGSLSLTASLREVRQEHQGAFRRWLLVALACGLLFTAIQSYALWAISPIERSADATSRGVRPFVMLLCLLHALHFVMAILSLCYITVRAYADKYDHEYHWGVTLCASLWHFLGVVWIGVLTVIAIAL